MENFQTVHTYRYSTFKEVECNTHSLHAHSDFLLRVPEGKGEESRFPSGKTQPTLTQPTSAL